MNTPSASTDHRLSRLERDLRRWRIGGTVVGMLLIASAMRSNAPVLAGDADPTRPVQDLIRTRKLLLVDDQDRTVASLSAGKNQISGLTCFDPETGTRVSGFGAGTDGSGVLLIATKKGDNVVIHSGMVNDQGIPLERAQQALQQLQHINTP